MTDLTAIQTCLMQMLQTERPLPAQVLNTLTDRYEQTEASLPDYFANTIPTLEDVDLDLLFSPAFTPSFADKTTVFGVLKSDVLSAADITALIQALKNVSVAFVTPTGLRCPLQIPEVNLTRFITRLGLDKPVMTDVYAAIESSTNPADQATANTLARDEVWKSPGRHSMLIAVLSVLSDNRDEAAALLTAMTDFIRTYRPHTLEELEQQLESYIRSCESDLSRSGELHFHDEHLKEKYLMNDQGAHNDAAEDFVRQSYLHMMDTGRSLRTICEQVAKRCPHVLTAVS